jgi:hypothetical protein
MPGYFRDCDRFDIEEQSSMLRGEEALRSARTRATNLLVTWLRILLSTPTAVSRTDGTASSTLSSTKTAACAQSDDNGPENLAIMRQARA